MANELWFGVIVEQNGKRLGTLAISPNALGWTREGANTGRALTWAELDQLLGGGGRTAGARKGKRKAKKAKKAEVAKAAKPASKPQKAAAGTELRARYRGKAIAATLRADGKIVYAGKTFDSPSAAATAAVKKGRRDGWQFWKVQNARGKWVALDSRRK